MEKLDELEYRKEIWAMLKEFRDSKVMTLEEVTDRIMAIPVTEKEKGKVRINKEIKGGGIKKWLKKRKKNNFHQSSRK